MRTPSVHRWMSRRAWLAGGLSATSAAALAGCGPRARVAAVAKSAAAREVSAVIEGIASRDGAGVALTRALGHGGLSMLDPFLLLDEIHSDDPREFERGFPTHPHRGFETVSYLLSGAFEHRDSVGNQGRISAGATQWMTAGRGILHEEMPRARPGEELWGFQLWVNLPAAEKMTAPRYQELAATDIPELDVDDARVRLVAGAIDRARGPVDGVSIDPTFLDVTIPAGGSFRHAIDGSLGCFAYVIEGSIAFGTASRRVREGCVAVLGEGDVIVATSARAGRALILAGRPIGEPIARRGPFVMNTQAELEQAFADYRAGRIGE